MGLAELKTVSSWVSDASPMVMGEIFSENNSVTVWTREPNAQISEYFSQVFPLMGLGTKQVLSMASLREGLADSLPEATGKSETVEDIYLLADMLTCLFNCDSVGLRLVPLSKAMCPKFHSDNIQVRLVNTYLGPGTEWLPSEAVHKDKPQQADNEICRTSSGFYYNQTSIQQMKSFDVGLLKGSAWERQEHMGAIHRSCQVDEDEKRVLLTLDPM